MFERRLKILLLVLVLLTLGLFIRVGHVQVVNADYWRQEAVESMKRWQLVETTRGSLLDHHGRPIAMDQPCIDACVDYRVIGDEPDPKWLEERARQRLL